MSGIHGLADQTGLPGSERRFADDLLEGADAIADFLKKDVRQIYHLAAKGQLPIFKLGSVLHARRSTLTQFFADREAAALRATGARKNG